MAHRQGTSQCPKPRTHQTLTTETTRTEMACDRWREGRLHHAPRHLHVLRLDVVRHELAHLVVHHRRPRRLFDVRTAVINSLAGAVGKLTGSVSPSLYGITILQAFIYYKQNARDLIRVQVLVRARPLLPLSP